MRKTPKRNHPWRMAWSKKNKSDRDYDEYKFEGLKLYGFYFPVNPSNRNNKFAV